MGAEAVTRQLGGAWRGRSGRAPCPICAGKLQVKDGEVGLLAWCYGAGCSFSTIVRELRNRGLVGDAPRPMSPRPPPRVRPPPADDLMAMWHRCRLVEHGSVAAIYLLRRGCALPHPDGDLRWAPVLRHPSGHVGLALVGLVTHVETAVPMTAHRTWVASDGSGKAALERPRLLWPGLPKAGGCIRLWPDAEVTMGLCVAEGVESALAAARGFGSAWAALDAGNLAEFPMLAGIDALTIVADHDAAGRAAAERCAARWAAAGREVRVWRVGAPAQQGSDIADWAAADAH